MTAYMLIWWHMADILSIFVFLINVWVWEYLIQLLDFVALVTAHHEEHIYKKK